MNTIKMRNVSFSVIKLLNEIIKVEVYTSDFVNDCTSC